MGRRAPADLHRIRRHQGLAGAPRARADCRQRPDQEEAFRRTRALLEEELEGSRERKDKLETQVGTLKRYLERSRKWLNFSSGLFCGALNTSLQLTGQSHGQAGAPLALRPRDPAQAAADPDRAIWEFPSAEELPGGDAVFRDPQEVNADRVHLHLEHPLVQRLLRRFLLPGFQSDARKRAAVLGTSDDTAKLIVLARLSLYGHGAARLHDEVLAVVAEWDPADPSRRLRKLSDEKSRRALEDLEASLQQRLEAPEAITAALKGHLAADVDRLARPSIAWWTNAARTLPRTSASAPRRKPPASARCWRSSASASSAARRTTPISCCSNWARSPMPKR